MAQREVRCPLCGSPAADRMALSHTTVCQCASRNCGLQFAYPQPDERELSSAYSNLYYPANDTGQQPHLENTPEATLQNLFQQLEKRTGSLRGLTLLDYGCGRGPLLRVAAEFGMKASGIEADPQARSVASSIPGVTVFPSIAQMLEAKAEARFDVVILWTVIEHLRTPWRELAELRALLQPGGWLLISTMDIRCLRARIEGRKWENYENPTHLYYFDRVSLAQTIREAGFTDFTEWRLKLDYPQHGPLRRMVYDLSFSLGVSDGLFFLCRAQNGGIPEPALPGISKLSGQQERAGQASAASSLSEAKSRP